MDIVQQAYIEIKMIRAYPQTIYENGYCQNMNIKTDLLHEHQLFEHICHTLSI